MSSVARAVHSGEPRMGATGLSGRLVIHLPTGDPLDEEFSVLRRMEMTFWEKRGRLIWSLHGSEEASF
ncbi:MAG: hypothetical protein JWR49_531 [Tardiphaga sp.]|nr:hypothetical protein [Tardiphaga sp.]